MTEINKQINKEMAIKIEVNFHYYVGIDVSKKKLNVAVLMQGRIVKSLETVNMTKGFKELVKALQKLPDSQAEKILICMESTSIYHLPLANYLTSDDVHFGVVWVENPAQSKQYMGFRRGQNTKKDDQNFAE